MSLTPVEIRHRQAVARPLRLPARRRRPTARPRSPTASRTSGVSVPTCADKVETLEADLQRHKELERPAADDARLGRALGQRAARAGAARGRQHRRRGARRGSRGEPARRRRTRAPEGRAAAHPRTALVRARDASTRPRTTGAARRRVDRGDPPTDLLICQLMIRAVTDTRLKLRVQPGARSPGVVGRHGDAWKVRVTAAPERGNATEAVLALLADTLGVAQGDVTLVSGGASRDKVVRRGGNSAGGRPNDALRRRGERNGMSIDTDRFRGRCSSEREQLQATIEHHDTVALARSTSRRAIPRARTTTSPTRPARRSSASWTKRSRRTPSGSSARSMRRSQRIEDGSYGTCVRAARRSPRNGWRRFHGRAVHRRSARKQRR